MELYFKDDLHEAQTAELLEKFNLSTIKQDVERGALIYIVGAVYKGSYLIKCIDEYGDIDFDDFYDYIALFSTTEQEMLRFGIQCFNGSIDDIKLSEVMRSLDDRNTVVIKEAINIRY